MDNCLKRNINLENPDDAVLRLAGPSKLQLFLDRLKGSVGVWDAFYIF